MDNFSNIYLLVEKIHQLFEKKTEPIIHRYNLTPSTAWLLMFLYRYPEKNTASEIVASSKLKRGNVSTMIENLCERNLIIQQRDENDKRQQRLFLNDESIKISKELKEGFDFVINLAESVLDENQVQILCGSVEKIVSVYDKALKEE